MAGTVLILTHARDDTASMVIRHLQRARVPLVRFNTEEFQRSVSMTINLEPSGELRGCYHFPDRDLPFDEVGVVWNRRVREPSAPLELEYEPEFADWAVQETKHALFNSFTVIDAPVVNPWEENERIKFNKIVQMRRATELGFEVPKTRLTSVPSEVRLFAEEIGSDPVVKKIRKGRFTLNNGRRFLLHTTVIKSESLTPENLKRMRFFPMFIQECVKKKFDIRAIVVGERVFSFAIYSQEADEGKTDFRTAAVLGKELRHKQIDLGNDVNSRLVTYTKSFGLSFSAIDLVMSHDNRLVFLEDNPNGQWGWLEQLTGAPISLAFAEHLIHIRK